MALLKILVQTALLCLEVIENHQCDFEDLLSYDLLGLVGRTLWELGLVGWLVGVPSSLGVACLAPTTAYDDALIGDASMPGTPWAGGARGLPGAPSTEGRASKHFAGDLHLYF